MLIKKFLIRTLLLLSCAIMAQNSFSQNKTISGKISDDNGSPLSGVTVTVKGAQTSTVTDENGVFVLKASDGVKTLLLSSVGYTNQEVNVTGKSEVNVSLQSAAKQLNEVVVVGYGTQRKKDLTGAVAVVDVNTLKSQPAGSAAEALQ